MKQIILEYLKNNDSKKAQEYINSLDSYDEYDWILINELQLQYNSNTEFKCKNKVLTHILNKIRFDSNRINELINLYEISEWFSEDDTTNILSTMVSCNNSDFVKFLLKHPNIDINIEDNYGRKALDYASEIENDEKRKEITNLFLDYMKIDETKTSDEIILNKQHISDGFTPLMMAVETKNIKLVEKFLNDPNTDINQAVKNITYTKNGIQYNTYDSRDYTTTAASMACGRVSDDYKNEEIAEMIVMHPDYDITTENVLNYAMKNGYSNVVKYILKHPGVQIEKDILKNCIENYDMFMYVLNHIEKTYKKPIEFGYITQELIQSILMFGNHKILDYLIEKYNIDIYKSINIDEVVLELVECGCDAVYLSEIYKNYDFQFDVNRKFKDSDSYKTYIIEAIKTKNVELVKFLLNHPDINLDKDVNCGVDLFEYSERYFNREINNMLIEKMGIEV